MSKLPRVSVLMPVYNAGIYLSEAIESILNQSFQDFEFLIINDGSTDNSENTILSYQDKRIRYIRNDQNIKLIATLNKGIDLCRGDYIVRMDADDISLPQRIEKQVAYLDAHPEIGLCGSWFENFGEHVPTQIVKYLPDDTSIRIRHLYQTHIAHPTAVLRSSVLKLNQLSFDKVFIHGEDYHFWTIVSAFCKMGNLQEVLVRKRDHPANISNAYASTMNATCNKVKIAQFGNMGVQLSIEDVELYSRFANPQWDFTAAEMQHMLDLLESIESANALSAVIPIEPYRQYLAEKWYHLCLNAPEGKPAGPRGFYKLRFSKAAKLSLKDKFRLHIKHFL